MSNRNLYGFALFAFIIVTTIFVNSIFFKPTIKTVLTRAEISYEDKSPVWTQSTEQAVLNLRNKTLVVNLDLNKQINFEAKNGFKLRLHFFPGPPSQRVDTETVWIHPSMVDYRANIAKVRLTPTYPWLNHISQGETLYVIPQVASSSDDAAQISASFDESDAIPVLIIHK